MAYLEAGRSQQIGADVSGIINNVVYELEKGVDTARRKLQRVNWRRVASDAVSVGLRVIPLPLPVIAGVSFAFGDPRPAYAQGANCVNSAQVLTITGANSASPPPKELKYPAQVKVRACKDNGSVNFKVVDQEGNVVGNPSDFDFPQPDNIAGVMVELYTRINQSAPNSTSASNSKEGQTPPESSGSGNKQKEEAHDMTPIVVVGGTLLLGAGAVLYLVSSRMSRSNVRKSEESALVEPGTDAALGLITSRNSGDLPGDFDWGAEVYKRTKEEAKDGRGQYIVDYPSDDARGIGFHGLERVIGRERKRALNEFYRNRKVR